jgi:hypothetical protein
MDSQDTMFLQSDIFSVEATSEEPQTHADELRILNDTISTTEYVSYEIPQVEVHTIAASSDRANLHLIVWKSSFLPGQTREVSGVPVDFSSVNDAVSTNGGQPLASFHAS